MTNRQRKALRIAGWVLLTLVLLGGIGVWVGFQKRETLLKTALAKAKIKAKKDYQLNLAIDSAYFSGFTSVAFDGISIIPDNRDSLARIGHVDLSVRFWPLLRGNIGLSRLTLENGLVQVVKQDSLTNIDFLLHRQKDSTQTRTARTPTDLSDVAERIIDNLLSKIPDDLDVKNLAFRVVNKEDTLDLLTQAATIHDENVTSTILVNGKQATWHLTGQADPADREYDLALYADGKPLELPYLERQYKLKLQIDTLRGQLRDVSRRGDQFRMEGGGSVRNMRIHHPAVARTDVVVPDAALTADMFVGRNYVGVDSSSTLRLGSVQARPFLNYTLTPTKQYELQLHTDMQEAQAIFDSFPQGLFESLEGMKVTGKLKYDMAFYMDSALPDSVKFTSGLTPENFRILQMGATDFAYINRPFVYTPYEKDKPVRAITVGPSNPDFTPLNRISPNLRNALLTSEDYTFFTHKGFNEKAFRASIATNFKEKSFKRGASTISMQLVKNVFLNRNKTLSRKVEEILIVWLIENQHLVPKERMYEVYLNIIEWGRNIYGIGEAARYYFAKTPATLSLGESIFLAFVVPRPKAALQWFMPDGTLQARNVRGYFRIIGRLMASRGLTQPDSGAYGFYDVRLREGLRQQVPQPVFSPDSLDIEPIMPDDDLDSKGGIRGFFQRLFHKENPNEETPKAAEPPAKTEPAPVAADTVKTRKQLRQERRERKRQEREAEKQAQQNPPF